MGVTLFISCATGEFGRYREALLRALDQFDVTVKIQDNFKHRGDDTLRMLEDYIAACDGVVHFLGQTAGDAPPSLSVARLLERRSDLAARLQLSRAELDALSYTQWEAWLAVYFERKLVIVTPAPGAAEVDVRGATPASRAAQAEHLKRLQAIDRWPAAPFENVHHLASLVMTSAIKDALDDAGRKITPRKPNNLPYGTLGALFKGRNASLKKLHTELLKTGRGAVAGKAVHGLGGVGKTRLAVEYALRYASEYSALLFVGAETPERLDSNLAGLVSAAVFDLPEQEAREDAVKIAAALGWLGRHPTWLLIFDNVDDEAACDAVARYLPRLEGGHVLVTGRLSDYPAEFSTFDLGVLDPAPARDFLLQRTQARREKAANDDAQAAELARELGGLALGLEQAGAYVAQRRTGFARYLELWREKRETVLAWFDPRQMSYAHDVGLATTWATSVARLDAPSLRLLDRLAFFAPEPIPNFLLDVKADGDDLDAREALPGLFAYSLASSAEYDDGKVTHAGFAVHRLVQDYARRAMDEGRHGEALREAMGWVNAGFQGDPQDVRTWPRLNPLAPHALAAAEFGHRQRIAEPTAHLLDRTATLSQMKARYHDAETGFRRAVEIAESSAENPNLGSYINDLAFVLEDTNRAAEAEPLYRRALEIDEASHGPDHPAVAICLNNLAGLLRDTNRSAEAEPLFRRAIASDEANYGPDHPNVARGLNHLAMLLHATNRATEAEPLFRRALTICEARYGPDHPTVAIRLNNLAALLLTTNRAAEAEPLYRRALKIDEASYGLDHPHVANRLNNLALLLRATNRAAQAEPLFRRALAICKASYGPDHPHTWLVRENLEGIGATAG